MKKNEFFFNGCFDKNRIKLLISWSLQNCGEQITIDLVENLKSIGFNYATQAGISLGIDDLKIPPTKAQFILDSDIQISSAQIHYKQGYITGIEKFQQLIDIWHRTSDTLKQNVIQYFKVTNVLNPVYMMAFSGARGNISQVRQLVGMRGLMSDPQGQILDFPIKSNFREGLTLTEYVISCYGARKGLVDTALKTANSGYLTRRLVDVSHHIIVCEFDCKTKKGVILNTIIENNKIIVPLQNRLVGRILAENIYFNFSGLANKKNNLNIYAGSIALKNKTNFARQVGLFSKLLIVDFVNTPQNWIQNKTLKFNNSFPSVKNSSSFLYQLFLFLKHVNIYYTKQRLIATKNQEVSLNLAMKIASLRKQVLVRSPLTCEIKNSICQLCYGWSLAHGKLVSLGEAVGILAAQSIGEPGTQLTMRTFHTGGVFSGDMMSEIRAPFDGIVHFSESFQGMLIRTPHGKIAFLTKIPGKFEFYAKYHSNSTSNEKLEKISFQIPSFTILFIRNHEYVLKTQIIAEFSSISADREQRIQANHDLNTEIEGEIFFKNVIVHARKKKNKLISRTTANLGSIWVVSGKIYTQPIPIALFPQSGDLVDQISIIGQYKTISPYNGFLTTSRKNSLVLSATKHIVSFNYQSSKIGTNLPMQVDFSSKASLQLVKKNNNFSCLDNKTALYNQSKRAKKITLFKNNSKKIKSNNNRILLHHPIISFPIQYIQYKKIGYFFSVFQPQKPQFSLDRFFLSNSLQQKFYNLNKLHTTFYFQSFPKQYQTQTGGILFHDHFYLNEKLNCGEVFWIAEENYIFNFDNSICFEIKGDKKNKIINSTLLFSTNRKPYLKKPEISLFKSKPKFKISLRACNPIPIYNWIKKKRNFRKWFNRGNPLIFNYNNQGKILNIYPKLSGFLEIIGINLFSFKFTVGNVSAASLSLQEKYKYEQSEKIHTENKRKTRQNTSLCQLGTKNKNDWKAFSCINEYQCETIGVKRNPIIFIFQLFGFNFSTIKNLFLMRTNCSSEVSLELASRFNLFKKKLNTTTFLFNSNSLDYHILKYFKKKKTVHKKVFKKNSLPFLQPKFPWAGSYQYNFFESSINTSFFNQIKPLVSTVSISSSSLSIFRLQGKKQIQNQSKNKYKSIVKFYQSNKKKIKQKNKALNKVNFDLAETKLDALYREKKLIKAKIKPGWIYFPKDIKKAIQKHKLIIKPGEKWCDNILFDQYGVYIECLALNKILNNNKKDIEITSPVAWFLSKQNLDNTNIRKKNSNLINLLNIAHVYTEFNLSSSSKNQNLYSTKIKQNFINLSTNCKLSINFLEILETIFQNTYTTPFFNKNLNISPFLFRATIKNSIFNTNYTIFLLEKYIQKNKLQFLYLLHKEFIVNSTIQNNTSLQIDFLADLLKLYNYKKIYFVENYTFLKNVQKITNSVLVRINLKNKIFFSLFEHTPSIQRKCLIEIYLSTNLLKKNYCNKENILHSLFFRSTNTFLPESFILIRKIISYPFISQLYYKKLLAQQNKTSLYSFNNFNISNSGVPNWNHSLSFNKQNNTQLFYTTPPTDFLIKPYFKYRNFKKNIFFKNNTILEFYMEFKIPLNYSVNAAKIQLTSKSVLNRLNLKTINFFALFCNTQKNWNRISNLKTGPKFRRIPHLIYRSNFLVKQRNKLNFICIIYLNLSIFHELQFSNNETKFPVNTNIELTRTSLVSYFQNFVCNQTPVSLIKFFSPYQGEILETQIKSAEKTKYLVLTYKDQTSFSIPNLFRTETSVSKTFLGKFIHYGTKMKSNCVIPESGLIIQIEKSKITVRKAQPILFSSKGLLSVHHGDLVEKNALILRLFYQRLKTGDIVQGIPKIEQLFEARKTNQGELLIGSLHEELEWLFIFYKKKYDFQTAARKSLEKIQQIIVNNVQKVYQSQGVTIAEKHLEIIVRQMTSKVQIITSGQTNLIPGELIDLDWIEIVNKGIKLKKKKVKYKPIILGITKKSLETKSFISEASFQETTRILAKSAIERKTDFLKGLKENVILGHLIPAGTGFAGKVFDSDKPKFFATNNYESYTIFRKIFLETIS